MFKQFKPEVKGFILLLKNEKEGTQLTTFLSPGLSNFFKPNELSLCDTDVFTSI